MYCKKHRVLAVGQKCQECVVAARPGMAELLSRAMPDAQAERDARVAALRKRVETFSDATVSGLAMAALDELCRLARERK